MGRRSFCSSFCLYNIALSHCSVLILRSVKQCGHVLFMLMTAWHCLQCPLFGCFSPLHSSHEQPVSEKPVYFLMASSWKYHYYTYTISNLKSHGFLHTYVFFYRNRKWDAQKRLIQKSFGTETFAKQHDAWPASNFWPCASFNRAIYHDNHRWNT